MGTFTFSSYVKKLAKYAVTNTADLCCIKAFSFFATINFRGHDLS